MIFWFTQLSEALTECVLDSDYHSMYVTIYLDTSVSYQVQL